jgi:serine/threonine protein kinase
MARRIGAVFDPTHVYGTYAYCAPELFLTTYCPPSDLWSIGVTLWCMLHPSESEPFGDTRAEALLSIFTALGTPTEETWPGVTALPLFPPTFKRIRHQVVYDPRSASLRALMTMRGEFSVFKRIIDHAVLISTYGDRR